MRHPNSEEILPVDHGRLLKAKTDLLVTLHQHTDSLFWPRSGPSAEVPSGLQHVRSRLSNLHADFVASAFRRPHSLRGSTNIVTSQPPDHMDCGE